MMLGRGLRIVLRSVVYPLVVPLYTRVFYMTPRFLDYVLERQ